MREKFNKYKPEIFIIIAIILLYGIVFANGFRTDNGFTVVASPAPHPLLLGYCNITGLPVIEARTATQVTGAQELFHAIAQHGETISFWGMAGGLFLTESSPGYFELFAGTEFVGSWSAEKVLFFANPTRPREVEVAVLNGNQKNIMTMPTIFLHANRTIVSEPRPMPMPTPTPTPPPDNGQEPTPTPPPDNGQPHEPPPEIIDLEGLTNAILEQTAIQRNHNIWWITLAGIKIGLLTMVVFSIAWG